MGNFAPISLAWLADIYLQATLLLALAWAAPFRLAPARRLPANRAALIALFVVLALSAAPGLPRISLGPSGPPSQTIESAPVVSPQSTQFMLTASPANQERIASSALPARPRTEAPRQDTSKHAGAARFGRWASQAFTWIAAALCGWFGLGYLLARRLLKRCVDAPDWLQNEFRTAFKPRQPVRLVVSPRADPPQALGAWRPTIILPQWFVENASSRERRAALAHEWGHIRRGDLWRLAELRILSIVLFAHPLFWLFWRRIRFDQEVLADFDASQNADPVEYAAMLVRWSQRCALTPCRVAAFMADKSRLKDRISRLIDPPTAAQKESDPRQTGRRGRLAWAASLALMLPVSAITLRPEETKQAANGVRREAIALRQPVSPGVRQVRNEQNSPTAEPLRVSLMGGVSLELIGVQDNPCFGLSRWGADGRVLTASDTSRGRKSPLSPHVREIVLRIHNPCNFPLEWKLDAAQMRRLSRIERQGGVAASTHALTIAAGEDKSSINLKLAYGVGQWETVSSSRADDAGREIRFHPCDDSDDTVVTVSHRSVDEDLRVVAVDRAGRRYAAAATTPGDGVLTVAFRGVSLDQIDSFFLQARPASWVEFRDVSLTPGHSTQAHIVTPSGEFPTSKFQDPTSDVRG